jgi:hypothetical protein
MPKEIMTVVKILSNPRFIVVYSGILTITFLITVALGLLHGDFVPRTASTAADKSAEFDQITVRRINVVEPDGTPRLVIAGRGEFPGAYFKGKDIPRSDRAGYAGMIFMDDEGTENGGLIFGGHQSKDGSSHSFGHLSFDDYESNQTLSLDTNQQGDRHNTLYSINDNDAGLRTPEVLEELEKARSLADGGERQKVLSGLVAKYRLRLTPRAGLERLDDKSVALRLRDPEGNTRILLRVSGDGTPSMQFLDTTGKIKQQWPEATTARDK